MAASGKLLSKLCFLGIFFISQFAFAASADGRCPTCQVNYLRCSWNCFSRGGWQPVCAGFKTAKQQRLNRSADPSSYSVYSSMCDAKCYLKYYGSINHYAALAPTFKNSAGPSCEQLWKIQAALILQSLQSAGAAVKVPAWLRSVAATNPTSMNYTALDACLSCVPSSPSPPEAAVEPSMSPPVLSWNSVSTTALSPSPMSPPSPPPSPVPSPMPSPPDPPGNIVLGSPQNGPTGWAPAKSTSLLTVMLIISSVIVHYVVL